MARYTRKSLEADVVELNEKLTKIYGADAGMYADKKSLLFLQVGARNGYTAVDLVTVKDNGRSSVWSTLQCGTPRECLERAQDFVLNQL